MALILLILEVIFIVRIDRSLYNTYFTPGIVLSVPFLVITLAYYLFSDAIGVYSLYDSSLYIWVFGLAFFWLSGFMIYVLHRNVLINGKLLSLNLLRERIKLYNRKLLIIGVISSIVVDLFLLNAVRRFGLNGGEKLSEYLGMGLVAHLGVWIRFISIGVFMSLDKRLKQSKLIIAANILIFASALAYSLLYATKSSILFLVISCLIAKFIYFDIKIKVKHIILILIFGLLVFYITYSIVFGFLAPLNFIFNHIIFYFVSGVSAMSQYIHQLGQSGVSGELIFQPFYNLVNKLEGKEIIKVVSDINTAVGGGYFSNVKTFFGTIYIYGGLKFGISAVVLFGMLSYFLCIFSIRKNLIAVQLYGIVLAYLLFGFFDFYFNTISFYESCIYDLLLSMLVLDKNT